MKGRPLHSLILLALITGLFACNPVKHVPEGGYLLDKYEVGVDKSEVDKKELDTYVRPKPNRKILGYKFYLGLYNLSGTKESGWNRWLQKIGENPVLYDEYETERNNNQIRLYLKNKGYYHASISDSVKVKKKKARVTYHVEAGKPYIIRNINYVFDDRGLESFILPDTANSLIRRGNLFDVDVMQNERVRIEKLLRNQGFYHFNSEYILYDIDSSLNAFRADVRINFKQYVISGPAGYNIQVPHRRYKVEKVFIYPDFDQKKALLDQAEYMEGMDHFEYKRFDFLFEENLRANPGVISQSIFIIPDSVYSLERVSQSYTHLSSLRIYKLVNIIFEEKIPDNPEMQDWYKLICHIQLSPSTLQSYTVELEGTNSSGNIGVGGNLNYQHVNLFGGAENFNFRLSGAIETIKQSDEKGYGNMVKFGTEGRISLPKFLLPFKTEQFIRKYNPKTNILLAFSYQKRPDYTRSIANTSFGYNWNVSSRMTHIVNPVQINFVNMIDASKEFLDSIKDTYLQYSYEDRLIFGAGYSFIFSNQTLQKSKDFYYFRANMESSGLFLSAISKLIGQEPDSLGIYQAFGNKFAQFVKGDVEFRYFNLLDEKTNIVYRIFIGAAYPYRNSIAIPYEKQYFSGGANGIRAWQVRNLGPGSYVGTNTSRYPDRTADIKLEANLEYRFKLFWVLEGALFLDAGNIWSINENDDREGAQFSFDRFYKEIAVGTGLGLRLDLSFFLFRFDLGIKARDPAMPQGSRWVLDSKSLRHPVLSLAIGYPF